MDTNTYLIRKTLNSHIAVTILVTLTATLSMVINGLVTGQMLGSDALVAFGLASPIFILLSTMSGLISNGGSIRCAKHMGEGDMDAVAKNFFAATTMSILVGIGYTVLCLTCADFIAQAFGAEGAIEDMAAGYIRGLGLSSLPFLVLQNLLLYLRMDSDQRLALVSMAAVVIGNTVFAVYFSSATDLNLLGIGLAMALGNVLGLAIALLHFIRKERMLRFAVSREFGGEVRSMCTAGLPTAINRGSQTLKNLILNMFLLEIGGTTAVLALSVQTNVYQFLIAISTGYGLMVAMMCGMFFGERDKRAIVDTVRIALKSGFIISAVAGTVLFAAADPIAALFIKNGGDVELAARCLRIFAFSQPTSTVCLVFLYMYQTMGNLVLSNIVSLTRGVFYVVAVSFVFAPIMGLDGVWISFLAADVLSLLTIMVAIKIKTGRFPLSVEAFVVASEGTFDFTTVCDISIRNEMSEVSNLSERIESMCSDAGIDSDKGNRIALCIEEMAGNVVKFAFQDGKEHYIDIRIIYNGDVVIFRMRDNGVKFNPLTDASEGHLGIKVVRAVASSVRYRYSAGLNNLTVTV